MSSLWCTSPLSPPPSHEQVHRIGSGEAVYSLEGLHEPTFLAADASSGTVFASVRRADARTGLPRSTVRALRWDDQRCRLDDLGDVAAAGAGFAGAHRPLAVVPAPSTSGGPGSYLVVGTLGTPELLVIALPECSLVHTHVLCGPAAAVAGLAADASGTLCAVEDASTGSTRLLRWPLPGMAVEGPQASSSHCMCLACKRCVEGTPVAVCSRCAVAAATSSGTTPLYHGWICALCSSAHRPGGRLYWHSAAAAPIATGLKAPLSLAFLTRRAPSSPVAEEQQHLGLNLVSAAAQHAADSEGEAGGREVLPVELPQQACVSPGSTATLAVLFIPATLEEDEGDVALFLRGPAGEALPPLSSAALALPPLKRVVCCAFDGPSGSLLVSDGSSLVALDADRRAVRWVIPLAHCVSMGTVPLAITAGNARAFGSVIVAAVRRPGRLCLLHVTDGSSASSVHPTRLATTLELPGNPWAIACDLRSGSMFVDLEVSDAPEDSNAPLPVLRSRHVIAAYHWVGPRGAAPRQVALKGFVPVPTDTGTEGDPRPIAVVPPAPGHNTSFLVVAGKGMGRVAGRFCVSICNSKN